MVIYFKMTITICCLLFSIGLQAQINESDSARFQANLSFTGAWQEGNAEVLIFRNKAATSFRPFNKLVFKTQNTYLYQAFFKRRADEDFFSRNFVYYQPQQKIYPFGLGFLATNFRRQVALRHFWGGGLTWQILRRKKQVLKLAISGAYESTRFTSNRFSDHRFDGKSIITTWRATAWIFGQHQLGKVMRLHYEGYYQPSLELSDNHRWQIDMGLDIPLWKFLDFRINYLHTYEQVVIVGTKQEDHILTFGIRLHLRSL